MIEKSKTVVLNILVILSIILSWMLMNSEPDYGYLYPAQYVEPNPVGERRQLKEVVKPHWIVLHYGNQKYTGAAPGSAAYELMMKEMEKWYFFNFTKEHIPDERRKRIMEDKKAIEVVYPTELPLKVMGEMFTFRGRADSLLQKVNRILIYEDDAEKETHALFSDKEGNMLQARTAITPGDLEQFYLSLGHSLPELMVYSSGTGETGFRIYLPKGRIQVEEYQYFYQPVPIPQMIQTLFVDPSLTRQVTERDGTAIYTDGSKAVQIPPDHRSIHYYDPLTDPIGPGASDSNIHNILDFVNQHGGWDQDYLLDSIKRHPGQEEETYRFRQYVGAYGIYGEDEEMIGSIEVVANRSYIVELHRSIIQLDTHFDHRNVMVMSGQELANRLQELGISGDTVEDIVLGYQARMMNDYHLTLSPKWIVKLAGKNPLIVEAKQIAGKEGSHGLEKGKDHSDPRIPGVG